MSSFIYPSSTTRKRFSPNMARKIFVLELAKSFVKVAGGKKSRSSKVERIHVYAPSESIAIERHNAHEEAISKRMVNYQKRTVMKVTECRTWSEARRLTHPGKIM